MTAKEQAAAAFDSLFVKTMHGWRFRYGATVNISEECEKVKKYFEKETT